MPEEQPNRMKALQRKPWLDACLAASTKERCYALCGLCRYFCFDPGGWVGSTFMDDNSGCEHPLEVVREHSEMVDNPDIDCWGFRPSKKASIEKLLEKAKTVSPESRWPRGYGLPFDIGSADLDGGQRARAALAGKGGP